MVPLNTPKPSSSSSSTKPKRKRSRFGCNNCKKMKIKCDEIKPQCTNCQKSKKHFNKCDYSIKLSWGGRPYKNETRKKAMRNCGFPCPENSLKETASHKPSSLSFNFETISPKKRTTAQAKAKVQISPVKYVFVSENEGIYEEYHGGVGSSSNPVASKRYISVSTKCKKIPTVNPKLHQSVSGYFECFPTSLDLGSLDDDDDNNNDDGDSIDLEQPLSKRSRFSLNNPYDEFPIIPTDSESSLMSNRSVTQSCNGSIKTSRTSVDIGFSSKFSTAQHLTNENLDSYRIIRTHTQHPDSCDTSNHGSDSVIDDAFRYDYSNFAEILAKAEQYEENSTKNCSFSYHHHQHDIIISEPYHDNSNSCQIVSNNNDTQKPNQTSNSQQSITACNSQFDSFLSYNAMNIDLQDHSTYEIIKPGLKSLITMFLWKVGATLPQFSESTIGSLVNQLLFPSYKLEPSTASQFMAIKHGNKFMGGKISNESAAYNLKEKKTSLMGIENFFTDLNIGDFLNHELFDINEPQSSNISIPFTESDDFFSTSSNFTGVTGANGGILNNNACALSKTSDNIIGYSDYVDIYSFAPVGVMLLDSRINDGDEMYQKDISSVYDNPNSVMHYYIRANFEVSIVPLPDLLRNVKYYRELFHFYINCATDCMLNCNDEFYAKLNFDNSSSCLIEKNPFKYQLPAIAFENQGILSMLLAISAALLQFKRNCSNLNLGELDQSHASARTLANLGIANNSISKYNYHKPIIQNLVSRAFLELTSNLSSNESHQESMVIIYLVTYLEKITCKELHWKLLDYDLDLVFTAMEFNLEILTADLQDVVVNYIGCSSSSGQLDHFLEFLITWFSTLTVVSGCMFKVTNVSREAIYKEDSLILKPDMFGGDYCVESSTSNMNMVGLDVSLVGELLKIMQLSKEKLQLVNKFRASRYKSSLKLSDIFNMNSGLIAEALVLNKKAVSKLNNVLSKLDGEILKKKQNLVPNGDNSKINDSIACLEVLKSTNKLHVYSALLILYRRVIMIPRDSEIAQKFSTEILNLSFELPKKLDFISSSSSSLNNSVATMFNSCLNFAIVCGAVDTLNYDFKRQAMLKIFELSKGTFNLNSFLAFEIIQENCENGMPLSEIIWNRNFLAFLS
ncbi:hypothetical protein DASC09_012250 [Saccharomycopsis crataegensis]|uniref:Zn(2)-C6 fungal-type domain-containing protein n=1 Tax=Saccharomycopsis crataegensis TaxID=43959 RepID=A0AAV5QHF7_9ASCO|nr:hypothetical protein DASC09_012250 [Saccharomycopsis crataegensis]